MWIGDGGATVSVWHPLTELRVLPPPHYRLIKRHFIIPRIHAVENLLISPSGQTLFPRLATLKADGNTDAIEKNIEMCSGHWAGHRGIFSARPYLGMYKV